MKSKLLLSFACIALLCIVSFSHAQNTLFELAPEGFEKSLKGEPGKAYKNLLNQEGVAEILLVKVNKKFKQANPRFSDLIGTGSAFDLFRGFEGAQLHLTSPDNFSIIGNSESGVISLSCKQGQALGYMTSDEGYWSIQSIAEGVIAFARIETTSGVEDILVEPLEDDQKPLDQLKNELDSEDNLRNSPNGNIASVLVLYTPNANNSFNVQNEAELAVRQLNDALINSDISPCQLIFRLVGVRSLSFNEVRTDIAGDLGRLRNNSTANSLRNNLRADLVVLLTNGNYTGAGGITTLGPNNGRAYAIAELPDATSTFTLAHEVGHMLGGRHQQCSVNPFGCDDGGGEGHGFTAGPNRITIMHTRTRIRNPNYSNPQVFIGGQATGRFGLNNNAWVFRSNANTINGFRNNVATVVSGPSSLCNGQTGSYSIPIPSSNVTWSVNVPNFTITAGQGTNEVLVRGNTTGRGSATLTATVSGGGCTITFSKTIHLGAPFLFADPVPEICSGFFIQPNPFVLPVSPGATSYQLVSNSPNLLIGTPNPIPGLPIDLIATQPGFYTATLTVSNACGSSSSLLFVPVVDCSFGGGGGCDGFFCGLSFEANVFPVPAKDEITIDITPNRSFTGDSQAGGTPHKTASSSNYSVTLVNVVNPSIRLDNVSLHDGSQKLDVSSLKKGVYNMIMKSGSETYNKRIIIQ